LWFWVFALAFLTSDKIVFKIDLRMEEDVVEVSMGKRVFKRLQMAISRCTS
jgi:hypothetical protein